MLFFKEGSFALPIESRIESSLSDQKYNLQLRVYKDTLDSLLSSLEGASFVAVFQGFQITLNMQKNSDTITILNNGIGLKAFNAEIYLKHNKSNFPIEVQINLETNIQIIKSVMQIQIPKLEFLKYDVKSEEEFDKEVADLFKHLILTNIARVKYSLLIPSKISILNLDDIFLNYEQDDVNVKLNFSLSN